MATLIWPSLKGLPNVSEITTATSFFSLFQISFLILPAEQSDSIGSKATLFPSLSTLLISIPALAQTKPCLVSAIITPSCILTSSSASDIMSSTSLGSLLCDFAILFALDDGSISAKLTRRSSAFEMILCVTTRTSLFFNDSFTCEIDFTIMSEIFCPLTISSFILIGIISILSVPFISSFKLKYTKIQERALVRTAFPNFFSSRFNKRVKSRISIIASALSFTTSTGQNPTVNPAISNNLRSLAPSTTTTISSFLIAHSLIIFATALDLSEVTLIITSSNFPSLKTSSLEKILSKNNSFLSLSVINVNPQKTAIIFHPALFQAWLCPKFLFPFVGQTFGPEQANIPHLIEHPLHRK